MEKYRRVLVLGDSEVGKTSFVDTLFSEFPLTNELINLKSTAKVHVNSGFPPRTTGC